MSLNNCIQPCATCIEANFYSCLSCTSNEMSLKNSLCLQQPHIAAQIIMTGFWLIYLIPILLRKRCMVLIRILDMIQFCAYFKYIKNFSTARQIYVPMGMRGWNEWSEGWKLFTASGEKILPIWTIQQSPLNKFIRIICIWLLVLSLIFLIGGLKKYAGDVHLSWSTYFFCNWTQFVSISFYITVQEMTFYCSSIFIGSSFTQNYLLIISFLLAIILTLLIIFLLIWMITIINTPLQQQTQHFAIKHTFLMSSDYHLFLTQQLIDLPSSQNKYYYLSNLKVLDILKKIIIGIFMCKYLYQIQMTLTSQTYQLLGLHLIFATLWYMMLPMNIKFEYLQFIICVLADILVVLLLLVPLYFDNDVFMLCCAFGLFILGFISIVIEYYCDIYKIIPVDLYNTGLKVVIQDEKLRKELQERKKIQKGYEMIIQKMQKQQKEHEQSKQRLVTGPSEQKLNDQKPAEAQNISKVIENIQQNGTEKTGDVFQIDKTKRRKMYQWNKQVPFKYSNTLDE